jgi:hypothetical protein
MNFQLKEKRGPNSFNAFANSSAPTYLSDPIYRELNRIEVSLDLEEGALTKTPKPVGSSMKLTMPRNIGPSVSKWEKIRL